MIPQAIIDMWYEAIDKYLQWYTYVIENGEPVWSISDERVLQNKTIEANNLISQRYTIQTQLNNLLYWDEQIKEAMKTFIKWINDELQNNWKDADFSIYYG
jgi:hypothetical protein